MSQASNYLENAIMDHIFSSGNANFTSPANLFVGLATASITDATTGTSVTEAAYTSYARVSTADADWAAAVNGMVDNGTVISFPAATGGSETEIDYFIADAATLGNILMYGTLNTALPVVNGVTPRFSASQLSVTLS